MYTQGIHQPSCSREQTNDGRVSVSLTVCLSKYSLFLPGWRCSVGDCPQKLPTKHVSRDTPGLLILLTGDLIRGKGRDGGRDRDGTAGDGGSLEGSEGEGSVCIEGSGEVSRHRHLAVR